MRVSRGKASVISDVTIDEDLDFGGSYQCSDLATPAANEALRKGNKDIGNAEIADAAAIAASKISGTALVRSLLTTQGDIITRNGSIPKRLAKGTAGYVLTMGASEPVWSILASPLTVPASNGTEVYNAAPPGSWTDLNLSGTVGAQATLVLLKVCNGNSNNHYFAFRKNGDSDDIYETNVPDYAGRGVSLAYIVSTDYAIMLVATDDSGVSEWRSDGTASPVVIDVIAYIK